MFAHAVGYAVNGKAGLENQENFSLLRSHEFFLKRIADDISDKKAQGDTVVTTLDAQIQQGGIQIPWKLSGSCDCYGTGYRKNHCNGVKTGL